MDLEIRTGLSEEAERLNMLAMALMVPGERVVASALCRVTAVQENIVLEHSDGVDYFHSEA